MIGIPIFAMAPPVLKGAQAETFFEVIRSWEREYLLLNV
jgi:hypothetical protein